MSTSTAKPANTAARIRFGCSLEPRAVPIAVISDDRSTCSEHLPENGHSPWSHRTRVPHAAELIGAEPIRISASDHALRGVEGDVATAKT
jgi:hypothetical protein